MRMQEYFKLNAALQKNCKLFNIRDQRDVNKTNLCYSCRQWILVDKHTTLYWAEHS